MAFDKQKWGKEYYLKNRDRILEHNKEWNKSNPEKMALIFLRYRGKYPERIKLQSKKYYQRNPEKRKAQWKKYRESHQEKRRIYIKEYFRKNPSAQHRYKKKMAEGTFTPQEWLELKRKYKFRCFFCKKRKKLTVDHIIPLSKKGNNYISNIQPLCKSCNSSKQHH